MREKRTVQTSIFEGYAQHEIGQELKTMSAWLDSQLDLLDWVAADVRINGGGEMGSDTIICMSDPISTDPISPAIAGEGNLH